MTENATDLSAVIAQDLAAPYRLIPPARSGGRKSRVVVTSPHSGRQYPAHFIAQAAMGLEDLRLVEDAGLDRLLACRPLPAPVLLAEFPRSFVDLNRDAGEIDAGMFDENPAHEKTAEGATAPSRYLHWGLGVIPKKAAHQKDIYKNKLPASEAENRLRNYYYPFHHMLTRMLADAKNGAGDRNHVLLIDCHSMPSTLAANRHGGSARDIVIGNDHGRAAMAALTGEARDFFRAEGLATALNAPFSGGHITRHYGAPRDGVSALQIEISRGLYLDEQRVRLKDGWQEVASMLCRFIIHMDEVMAQGDTATPAAAE